MSSPLFDMMSAEVRKMPADPSDPFKVLLDKAFLSAEVIVSTNVTEYFFAGTEQEYWHLDRHFPNLAPPFDSFWIETKAPTHISSEKHGIQSWNNSDTEYYKRPARWGAWFLNVASDGEDVKEYLGDLAATDLAEAIVQSKFWLLTVTIFRQQVEHGKMEPFWVFSMAINRETGQPLRNPAAEDIIDPFVFLSNPLGKVKKEIAFLEDRLEVAPTQKILSVSDDSGRTVGQSIKQLYEHEAILLMKPLLLAVSFMHCRNVERVAHPISPKQNKKRQARNLPPFNRFHTLTIEPMKRIIEQALAEYRGLHRNTDIHVALHRVRGHFKTYTAEKPLMGHAVGSWFWGPTARGTEKRGTVKKRYEVKR
jgi:hypothetical protein